MPRSCGLWWIDCDSSPTTCIVRLSLRSPLSILNAPRFCAPSGRHPFSKLCLQHSLPVNQPCMWFMEEPSQFSLGQTAQSLTVPPLRNHIKGWMNVHNFYCHPLEKGCLPSDKSRSEPRKHTSHILLLLSPYLGNWNMVMSIKVGPDCFIKVIMFVKKYSVLYISGVGIA